MYIVIAGDTELAFELGRLFLKTREDKIVMVVKGKQDSIEMNEKLDTTVVNSDILKRKTLDDLELNKCDVFVAATESEKDNLLSAIYAKNSGAKKIFVRIESHDSEEMLEHLGFTPINSESYAARAIELMISRPAVSELVNIGDGEFDILEVPAKETKLVGKEIGSAKGNNYTTLGTCCTGKYDFSKEKKIADCDTLILIVGAGKELAAEKEIGRKPKKNHF
ncbi:MAG: NAD-binding protein [archaeon]